MNPAKFLALPVRYRPWKPKHFGLIMKSLKGISRYPEHDHRTHVEACIDWLCRAQDQREGQADAGGVSAGWSFEDGWLPSYPETSGYIVETFLAAADYLGRPELRERAGHILDWELSIQNEDGSFPGHFGEPGSRPVVFNTGQISHGMMAGYEQLGRGECLEAAIRAGHWMVAQQDPDGCYRRNVHNDVPHTYNTRATWAMLRAGLAAGDKTLIDAARRNVEWALSQQNESGWYDSNAFVNGVAPFTHTIAYAVRGCLECGVLLEEVRFIDSALAAGRAMAAVQREDGWLAGTYDGNWAPKASYCCLTGLAQTSLNWSRMMQATGNDEFRDAVARALGFLKRNHHLRGDGEVDDGAVAGSAPIWGRYSMFEFPNWAAKFFADALMMDELGAAIPPLVKKGREG